MPTMTLGNGSIIVDDELQRQASDIVETVSDHDVDSITIRFQGQDVIAPPELSKFITTLLENVACGGQTNVQSLPSELTTTSAADIIGVSRPTLIKLVNRGEIQARKVGTHHRVRTEDVLRFREERAARRRVSFDALRAATDELEEN